MTHIMKKQKNVEQRDILQYFRLEAARNPMAYKDVDPRPALYHTGNGDHDRDHMGGMMTGKIKVIVGEDEEDIGEEPDSTQRDE